MNSETGKDFRERLADLIERSSMEPFAWAKAVGIPGATFNRIWNEGSIPKSEHLIRISDYEKVSIDWLLKGQETQVAGNAEYIGIPRYNASLSAGNGFWNEDEAECLDHIPFTEEFLRRRLGRSTASDLMIMSASGESMEPQISDGDLVMIDQKKTALSDGIFAFVHNGEARIKWLRKTIDSDIEVISLNTNGLFPKEIIKKEDTDAFQLIGKVVWCGHHFAR